jgi:hypothetical protein
MHTLKVVLAGLFLLGLFLLLGHWWGHGSAGAAQAALYFIGVWLLLAAGNMALGVVSAGYGVLQELPIFLLVFAVPSAVALLVRRVLFHA